jgi:hypothetical protein
VAPGDRVALLVNSLGATSPMELSIAARAAVKQLRADFQVMIPQAFTSSGTTPLSVSRRFCHHAGSIEPLSILNRVSYHDALHILHSVRRTLMSGL